MKIEDAEKIIRTTNYYSTFANETEDRALFTAYKCVVLCAEMKKDIIMLKECSDPIAHQIAAIFESKLETIEEESEDE